MPREFTLSLFDFLGTRPPEFEPIEGETQNEAYATSFLGTPVFDLLEIQAGTYREREQLVQFEGISLSTVLITVMQRKNIVSTPITGRAGTIKQYMGLGDYEISIRGGVFSEDNSFPEELLNTLITVCEAPVSLKVSSRFLNLFDIQEMVIKNYNFNQRQGHENNQIFEIGGLSNAPVELSIYNENS